MRMEETEGFQESEAGPEEKPVATFESSNIITFGRDGSNDVALLDAWVSPQHARIEKREEYVLVAFDGTNGVHHRGQRVVGSVRLADGDAFAIGRHDFVFRSGNVYRSVRDDEKNPVLIEAYDLTVQIPHPSRRRRRTRVEPLIDDVSFVVRRGTMLGVVGPSGSGKSTLLKAITGIQPATQGRLLFDKEDLYAEPGPHRGIGMVPQEDIVHRQLTVKRALRFAAALRCPREFTRAQRLERVGSVVRQLNLDKQLRTPIEKLSGGQRKRTSVAMELLSVPSLLCLDEPTSGLDPALDRDVMGELRDLAKGDKTVIVSTHSPVNLESCDHVLVMCEGRMVYFGPPGNDLFEFFTGAEVYTDVFSAISNEPEVWAQRYRTSPVFGQHVGQEQLNLLVQEAQGRRDEPTVAITREEAAAAATQQRRRGATAPTSGGRSARRPTGADEEAPPTPRRQFATLCARMAMLMLSDRKSALLVLGLPVALAALSHLIPGSKGLAPDPEGFSLEANRLLIVLVVGAAFMGIAMPIREIAGELTIYRRERAVGLSPTVYLLSKMFVFTIVDCVQVALFVAVTLWGRGGPADALVLPDATVEVAAAVALVAIASTALGLLVSSLVRTVEQTTPYLVVSVMAQLILSGALFQISGQATLEFLSWFNPARWGYAAAAATTDLQRFPFTDPRWHHDAGNWWLAMTILCVQTAALVGLTRWALTRYEHGRG
jgi:ABC transport system ATP-binding/permease protein